ncbi:MAG: hypothetical protein A4E19_05960 [Nitrospira sp. SG-bin1]|nr:MAG: hypothetical protein A4E19_05960 [Nitrospira sp. SG-bin1]
MDKFTKSNENLRKELAALGSDDSFVEDLRQLKIRYPERYLKHYLKYQEEWREIARRVAERLWRHISSSCVTFLEECQTKRLMIHGPTVRIQFEIDVIKLCEKWCLRWQFDVDNRTACYWVSSVLLNWKQTDDRPDLAAASCPPQGLVVPIVKSEFKPLGNLLHQRRSAHVSEVHITARSTVGMRDLTEAAARAYASLRYPYPMISNVPLKKRGGRPGIPALAKKMILDSFIDELRSHTGLDRELIMAVSQRLAPQIGGTLSIKSYEKLLAEARAQSGASSTRKRYLTAKLDRRK